MSKKPDKIKITGQKTCIAIYKITQAPEHFNKCPIIMSRQAWESIKSMVMREKIRPTNEPNSVNDFMNSIFSQFK